MPSWIFASRSPNAAATPVVLAEGLAAGAGLDEHDDNASTPAPATTPLNTVRRETDPAHRVERRRGRVLALSLREPPAANPSTSAAGVAATPLNTVRRETDPARFTGLVGVTAG